MAHSKQEMPTGWFQQKLLRSAVMVLNRPSSGAAQSVGRQACGQGSLGRFSEGGIWAGAAVRGTEAKFHPLTSALRGFLSGGSSSEREFGL